jgi:hypothetical protein
VSSEVFEAITAEIVNMRQREASEEYAASIFRVEKARTMLEEQLHGDFCCPERDKLSYGRL